MNKLPVAKTIFRAYEFTFAHLGAIIGLIWFPVVLSALLNILPQIAGHYADAGPAGAGGLEVEDFAVWLLSLLLSAVVYVAVVRQALGLRQGQAVFHFALGQQEFRVYGALLAIYFALEFLALVLIAAEQAGGPVALAAGILALPAAIFAIYVLARAAFLIVPSIVIESRIDFARIWSLSRGNVWRILAVALAVSVPLWLVWAASAIAILGHDLLAVMPFPETADPQLLQRHLTLLIDIVQRHTPELLGLNLILAPFDIGLSLAASAFSYRELAKPAPGTNAITA